MTADQNRPATQPARVRLLRCAACGRTDVSSPAELLGFTRSGWPRCCGEVMALFSPAAAGDTALDHPALPAG